MALSRRPAGLPVGTAIALDGLSANRKLKQRGFWTIYGVIVEVDSAGTQQGYLSRNTDFTSREAVPD
jgi:hypothetical protein